LKEIEDKILEVLSTSTGNILEDESAIAVITEAKRLGNDIAAKQKQGEMTEAAIDAARVAYAPCGEYLSTLFFCISGKAASWPNAVLTGSLPLCATAARVCAQGNRCI
jgi:dynein heavy chain